MSDRRRRFGRIKQAIKNGATGGYLAKYLSYQSGASPIKITKIVKRNGSVKKAMKPFGVIGTTATPLIVTTSGRSNGALATFKLTDTILGLAAVSSTAVRNRNILPAKAVLSDRGVTTSPKVSGITGLTYQKPANSDSYTTPFGVVGTKAEFEVQADIVTAVLSSVTASNLRSVSFKPERMYA